LQHRGNDLVESHSVFEMLTSESRSFASNFDKMLGHELIQKTLFGSDIALEDFEGMKVNNYMTSSILFAVCMFMSQKHKGYVIPPNKVFDTKSIHFIADNVAVVCPDCFAFANMRDDPDKYEHKLTVAVGEIMPQLINCKLSDPIAVLIPFSTKQTHWYVMCVYITKEMVSLVVFNSIPTIEDKEFTMDLLRVFCNCANMLFGKTTENFQRLVYDKFQQDDGTSCGVFSLFFVAMIQNNPGLINEFIIEQESLASTGRKGVRRSTRRQATSSITFDPTPARNAIQCIIFYMLAQREEVETEYKRTFRNGKDEFDQDATHKRRVDGIKRYMQSSDPAILDDVLDEFENSPSTYSEFKQTGQTVPPIASVVLKHYKEGGAPHMVQLYAGCVSTLKPPGTSDRIFTFAEALDMDSEEHDKNHFWVQNFFPTSDHSGVNDAVETVDQSVAVFFRMSPVLMERLRLAVMYLIFNKIGLCFDTSLSRAPLTIFDRELFIRLILQDTHYRSRVTRWLYFLRLFEMGHMANSFYALLKNEMANNTFQNLSVRTKTEWSKAMNRPLWVW